MGLRFDFVFEWGFRMEVKPIETVYKGWRFRSRLEARWAVFFDAMGIEYQYEPQGFQKGDFRYLPDFFLPNHGTWVEVKGSDESLVKDQDRIRSMVEKDSPLPGLNGSFDVSQGWLQSETLCAKCPGLLILGEIPAPNFAITYHPLLQQGHDGRLRQNFAVFNHRDLPLIRTPDAIAFFCSDSFLGPDRDRRWSSRPVQFAGPLLTASFEEANSAYRAARYARFEHGETGIGCLSLHR